MDGDDLLFAITAWAEESGLELYPHQEEAILELLSGSNVILATPTGSGKSLVALAAHARSVAGHLAGKPGRSWYTAPVKALVSEKFFDLCRQLGPENVGLLTGDSAVNADAPVICATTEILAHLALKDGPEADVDTVVLDEFHYYGDPDRGWAWQVPLLELPQASFLLLSATLGDVRFFREDLTRRTGRPTALVDDAVRPVPLRFEYRRTLLHHTIEELLTQDAAPMYLVNFSQKDAVAMASAMASVTKLDDEAKAIVAEELGKAKIPAGFGRDLARLLRNGVGVHHAGMLPRYRRLVERLTQKGVLKVISGTDTLGVGVNLPIRTVILTRLYKYDGVESRLLSAREFHQISGRAGRAGYDTEGLVIALAPEHQAENDAAEAKAASDPKKKRKLKKASAPRNFVRYDEETFDRLQAATPEPLESSFTMTPGMLMQLLDRPGDAWDHSRALLLGNHEPRSRQRRHVRKTLSLYKALRTAGVVRQLDAPDKYGRFVEVDHTLQDDFALDQLLSPFLLAAIPQLDREDDSYALAMLALVEAVVDNPFPILMAQKDKAKDEAMAAMKAAGVEYDERIAELDKINFPQPMREQIYDVFDRWRESNPWIGDRNIAPKGVVRDLWDRAMDFPSFVRYYGIKRSEGLLLRYLSDVYKTILRSVPDEARSDEVDELTDWLGAVIRATDSSLLDEWTAMFDPEAAAADVDALGDVTEPEVDVTTDRRAFRALVRTRVFRWVQYAATGQWEAWSDDLTEIGNHGWNERKLREQFESYAEAHPREGAGIEIGIDGDARGPDRFVVSDLGDTWTIEQIVADPEGHDEWYLAVTVDLPASAEAGEIVATFDGLHRR
ncbi:DEAD/DEAH box helicase [Actinospongicola halichondriae]|uniref:DEAD/DEAH box helicase n=1 Tax=Actinospongicola halichondriae TaxID=3236844 RepID=UPI003D5434AA